MMMELCTWTNPIQPAYRSAALATRSAVVARSFRPASIPTRIASRPIYSPAAATMQPAALMVNRATVAMPMAVALKPVMQPATVIKAVSVAMPMAVASKPAMAIVLKPAVKLAVMAKPAVKLVAKPGVKLAVIAKRAVMARVLPKPNPVPRKRIAAARRGMAGWGDIDFGGILRTGVDLYSAYQQNQQPPVPTYNPPAAAPRTPTASIAANIAAQGLPALPAAPSWWDEAAYRRENPDVMPWINANAAFIAASGWAHWFWWTKTGTDRQVTRQRIARDKAAAQGGAASYLPFTQPSPAAANSQTALYLAAGAAVLLLMRR